MNYIASTPERCTLSNDISLLGEELVDIYICLLGYAVGFDSVINAIVQDVEKSVEENFLTVEMRDTIMGIRT